MWLLPMGGTISEMHSKLKWTVTFNGLKLIKLLKLFISTTVFYTVCAICCKFSVCDSQTRYLEILTMGAPQTKPSRTPKYA